MQEAAYVRLPAVRSRRRVSPGNAFRAEGVGDVNIPTVRLRHGAPGVTGNFSVLVMEEGPAAASRAAPEGRNAPATSAHATEKSPAVQCLVVA